MKALVYVNKEKDRDNFWFEETSRLFDKYGLPFERISDETLQSVSYGDVLFVLGGDGTILGLTEFSNVRNVPIIGINAGKVGFLTEFERNETEIAIKSFLDGDMVKDERATMTFTVGNKTYYALNEVCVQRLCNEMTNAQVSNVGVSLDGNPIYEVTGDGVIVSTPTGSTAYSLSSGGAILIPRINAFSVTPVAPHSLHLRPIVYSADSECELSVSDGVSTAVFADGKFITKLSKGQSISVSKSKNPTVFLRRKNSDFYQRLVKKLYGRQERDL